MSQALNVALPQGLKRDIYAVPDARLKAHPSQTKPYEIAFECSVSNAATQNDHHT